MMKNDYDNWGHNVSNTDNYDDNQEDNNADGNKNNYDVDNNNVLFFL